MLTEKAVIDSMHDIEITSNVSIWQHLLCGI